MFSRGGGMPIPIGGGGLSITSLIVIGVICLMLGINPLELLEQRRRHPRMPDIQRPSQARGSPFEHSRRPAAAHWRRRKPR